MAADVELLLDRADEWSAKAADTRDHELRLAYRALAQAYRRVAEVILNRKGGGEPPEPT